jgi:hypothetical protein
MTHVYADVGDYSHPAKGIVKEVSPKERRAAIRLVCSKAKDAKDAALLLEALGIDPLDEYSVYISER